MRLIVPLQGVVQGRGGLILGSLIPCALFYFFQLYLKRNRSPDAGSNPPSPSSSNLNPADLTRTSSRSNLSSRGSLGPVQASSRAISIANPGDSPYYVGLEKVAGDPYDRDSNPNGIIQLGLSENTLCFDLIEKWMSRNLMKSMMDGETGHMNISGIATYQPFGGSMELKIAIADFMSRAMGRAASFDPSQMVLTAGATPAIEILCFCLADCGNAFLIPTPYYPGYNLREICSFDRDVKFRTGVELIPVHCRSAENFTLSVSAVDQAFNQAKKRGVKVRGILISNPSNPVGNIIPRDILYDLVIFARNKNIHIISDEIFAGSVYGDQNFVSMAEILDSEVDRSRVHVVYGLSKDLSLAGFRVGVIYSCHKTVVAAANKLTRFSAVSAPSQRILISMLSDERFLQEYMSTSKNRILKNYKLFVEGLKQLGIQCAESSAGLFCWVNMSSLISPCSEKGELDLWEKLLNVARINVTPGSACHCFEPGWFRCCFTTLAEEDIPVVIERIRKAIEACKS